MVNNYSFYPYEGVIKEYIDRYKFQGDYQLRHIFVNLMKKQLPQDCVIVPIPISAETMHKRHFNQVVGWLDLKFTPALIAKPKAKSQFEKNRLERLLTGQPFEIDAKYSTQIEAKDICLVDDIYTTGATVHHAAQLLKSAGAKTVRSITLAR
ncbi:phosphoribosyltransferase family protein [Fructilactobacillus vespulae]|uniref:ComF family protein n=1 Tax=Fructilactobacillus vespulae TaxID=1249630 RepID=UPI0039B4CDB3